MRTERRATLALVAIVAVVAAAVLAVFALGVRHVPNFPTVTERPDPGLRGRLVYSTYTDPAGRCIWVQNLGAAPRQFMCDQSNSGYDGYVAWYGFDADGRLVTARSAGLEGSSFTITTYDAETFVVISTRPGTANERPPDRQVRADGARVDVASGRRQGSWHIEVTESGVTRRVASINGPDDYELWNAEWSTDGTWIVVTDSERRFIVVPVSGLAEPRVLLRDVDQLDWYQPAVA